MLTTHDQKTLDYIRENNNGKCFFLQKSVTDFVIIAELIIC